MSNKLNLKVHIKLINTNIYVCIVVHFEKRNKLKFLECTFVYNERDWQITNLFHYNSEY